MRKGEKLFNHLKKKSEFDLCSCGTWMIGLSEAEIEYAIETNIPYWLKDIPDEEFERIINE